MKNNIDDFFKDGLGQNDYEYQESAWEGFKEIYEAEKEDDPTVFPFFNKALFIGGLLLLAGIGGFYFYGNSDDKNTQTENIADIIKDENSINNINISNNSIANEKQNNNQVAPNSPNEIKTANAVNSSKVIQQKTTTKQKTRNQVAIKAPHTFMDRNSIVSSIKPNNTLNKNELLTDKKTDKKSVTAIPTYKKNNQSAEKATIETVANEKKSIADFNLLPGITLSTLFEKPIQHNVKKISFRKRMRGHFFLTTAAGFGNKNSKNVELGFGRNFIFNKYLALNLSAKYKMIKSTTLGKHRGFHTKYSRSDQIFFGNHIEAQQMHYASIPLSIEVKYLRHRLNIGGAYNRLFLVRGIITKDYGNVEETHRAWIVETGMNKNLWSTNFSYGYQLSQSTQLFANAELFLTDSYNNESSISQKLNAYNVGLKYYLNSFRKNQTLRFL